MVHAGPLQMPSIYASRTIASRWAAISAAGSRGPCATAVDIIPKPATKNKSECLIMSVPRLQASRQGITSPDAEQNFRSHLRGYLTPISDFAELVYADPRKGA